MEAKEDTKDQPSPSPQDKDGAEAASNNDQTGSEREPVYEEEAKEQNISSESETGPSDVQSDSGTPPVQPKSSEIFTSNQDGDEEKDEPECKKDGDGEKSDSGHDEPDGSKSPATISDGKPDSGLCDESDGEAAGASGASSDSAVGQGKEKERPVIVSYMYTYVAAWMHACETVPFPFQNPSQCWWLSVTKWAVDRKLGPHLVDHVNNEFATNNDPYRTTKIK